MSALSRDGKPLRAIGIGKAINMMRLPGARLVKMHIAGSPEGFAHYIVPGGYVTPETAEKIKQHPLVVCSEDGLFPGLSQTWRIAS